MKRREFIALVGGSAVVSPMVSWAQQSGMRPEAFAQEVVNSGQLGALMSEVLRGKALALVLEHAKIRDTEGNEIDLLLEEDGFDGGAGRPAAAVRLALLAARLEGDETLGSDELDAQPEPAVGSPRFVSAVEWQTDEVLRSRRYG